MSTLKFELKVTDGGRRASLSISDGVGNLSGSLDAADADELIRVLGAVRASLAEQVPPRLELPARVNCIVDPAWWCDPKSPNYHLVAFRHPGYGWLGFALPDQQAKGLASWLLQPGPETPAA